MYLRLAAIAAWVTVSSAANAAAAADPLTLEDAFARVAERHPDLRLVAARESVLEAERDQALLPAPLKAGVEGEDLLGTGELHGVNGAEFTLTLASVLERGGKLDARRALAQQRIDGLSVEREARRLDLLAEIARRYLAATAALRARDIADLDIAQRERAVTLTRDRLRAGASPEAAVLTAEAALARAQLAQARAGQQWISARQHLASLWAEKAPAFEIDAGDPLRLPQVPDAAALTGMLERTPELARFTSAARIAEARVQLARSAGTPDLDWHLGIRGSNASDEVALVAGIQIPLGARRRAAPELRAARAELAALAVEREGNELALYATLVEAEGRYRVAQLEVATLRDQVLPALVRAEAASERAWRAGASTYLEWSQLQSELTQTRRQQLEAALDAQHALIEIQRLTGQAFVAGPDNDTGTTP